MTGFATTAIKSIQVLLIDDHAVVRSGLRMIIESKSGLKVVGEAGNRSEALAIAAREQPDIILLDLDLNGTSGLDFLAELFTVARHARVIILTGVYDPEAHKRAMHLGAMELVLKEKAAEVVIKAIEKVHAGEVWFDRMMMGHMISQLSRANLTPKSKPEVQRIAS